MLVSDDTAITKKGTTRSVSPAICLGTGQDRELQTLVSLTLARGEVPVMVALRLFLPDSWIGVVELVSRPNIELHGPSRRLRGGNRSHDMSACASAVCWRMPTVQ